MARVNIPLPQARKFLETTRHDRWWVQPLLVFLGLGGFIVYSTWAAIQGLHYYVPDTNYLSPMYSPVIWDSWKLGAGATSGHALMGPWPEWLPRSVLGILPLTPAFLILWAPGGFRFTCYYYRGAYYKAFWQDPTSCAVGEPSWRGTNYRGERSFPLVLQNVHRYFLYVAILFIGILSYDAIVSYWFPDPATGESSFGVGVGSLVLTLNPILLGGYTFGCHSFRHLVGGGLDRFSGRPVRKKTYDCVSCLNRRHMMWAWASLVWVAFCDVYVRLVSMGVWSDLRIL
ncbi:MAG: hypothetical protein WD749_10380 [Phycisphaerales bacterium]